MTGKAYDARLLSGSKGCGTPGCHEEILREWEVSAHRYSAMDAAFQAIQMNMAQQNGPESTRYCGGCHDPISLFSGTKNLYTDPDKLTVLQGYQEGVSCLTCHAVREVDVKGNANYQLGRPQRYMFELEHDAAPGPALRLARDFLIRAYPREHVRSLSKTLFKAPQYCAACHKQFVDQEINNVGWVQLQNQYDNWRTSRWNHPDDPQRTIECRECHMPLVSSFDPAAGDDRDYNRSANDGKHRSHRFLGANQMMPAVLKLPGWEEHVELVEKWLRGEIVIPEIADKWMEGPAVGIELLTPESVRAGATIPVKVLITSNKVGHDFPTGPMDIIQSWVEIEVRDDAGRVVERAGETLQVEFRTRLHVRGVDREDLLASEQVRQRHDDLPVEAAGPHQGRVE
ncbi:MAG: multiheme c-type cytochrome, partial [Acidobacteriota bacterium]